MQQVNYLIGTPVLSPYPFFSPFEILDDALESGTPSLSQTQIVVENTFGSKVVFTGDFTISGNDVTGGTMTGFEVHLGESRVIRAKGYDLDAAEFYDAVVAYGTDDAPFEDLILGAAIKFVGSKYGDMMFDTDFDDTLLGRKADDILFGQGGNDRLEGGKGNDFLADDEGVNKFFGDEGNDVFGFQLNSLDPPTAVNKLKDFTKGEDLISLSTDIPALKPGTLDPDYFHKGSSAADGDDYVIYTKATGKLFIDFDGSGTGAQTLIAKVAPGTKLAADDFVVGFGLMA
jgi:Ca2+-binding RTX toxin-like protein